MVMPDEVEHVREIALSEFESLRDEINNRTELSGNLVILAIGAFGTGVSVAIGNSFPEVFIAAASAVNFLWLLWLDHTEQIYKAATYIGAELAPRLTLDASQPLLGWEKFLRRLDARGRGTDGHLLADTRFAEAKVRPTQYIAAFIMMLFGASPAVLILGYGVVLFTHDGYSYAGFYARLVGWILSCALALFSWQQYFLFRESVRRLDRAFFREH
jgi:hypothetical protein